MTGIIDRAPDFKRIPHLCQKALNICRVRYIQPVSVNIRGYLVKRSNRKLRELPLYLGNITYVYLSVPVHIAANTARFGCR